MYLVGGAELLDGVCIEQGPHEFEQRGRRDEVGLDVDDAQRGVDAQRVGQQRGAAVVQPHVHQRQHLQRRVALQTLEQLLELLLAYVLYANIIFIQIIYSFQILFH